MWRKGERRAASKLIRFHLVFYAARELFDLFGLFDDVQ
jgi:hypothetical protein